MKMKRVDEYKKREMIRENLGARLGMLGGVLLASGWLSAGTLDHLEMGLDLVDHLLLHQTAGEFEDENQVELNQYGGSWGAGTLLVQPGDHENGILPYNLSKCGSFVTKLLNQSYGWNWSDYEFFDPNEGEFITSASPNSHRYMELIKQQIGFSEQLFDLVDVLPGDLMIKRDVGTTSGHTALVKEVFLDHPMPYPNASPEAQESLFGSTYFEVDVLDCSSSHHSNDSRFVFYDGLIYETNGAGVGTMGVLVDAFGTIIGHTWSLPSANYDQNIDSWVSQLNDKIRLFSETELVFGRLDLEGNNDAPEPEPEPEDLDSPNVANPFHFELGQVLLGQILEAQADGIFEDGEGVELNRRGGSYGSNSNPAMIRFADPDQGILPGNYNKGTTLVTLLLAEAYGWNWNDYLFFDTKKGEIEDTTSPSSTRYVDLIEQGVGFESQIVNLSDALPGDVMAIRYLSNWSGHTTMIHWVDWDQAKPYPSDHPDADPEWEGCWYVPVEVLDSTGSPHSFDTREVNGEELEGIGIGTMGVLINAETEIVGHTWSLPSADYDTKLNTWLSSLHSRLKPQTERRMVIGRMPSN